MIGFDPATKKYVSVMIGNTGPNLMKFDGQSDDAGKKFLFSGECPDPKTGKMVPHRMVSEITDKDHRTERVFVVDEGGNEIQVGEFLYTRRGATEAK
jgi:hypothetical protein